MRAQEFLTEAEEANYSLENARVSHPEDMIISMGSLGAKLAINSIKQMATNPETISIKPDGKPAIVWGRDENGFGMMDKHMFAKGIIKPFTKDDLDEEGRLLEGFWSNEESKEKTKKAKPVDNDQLK